MTPTQREYRIAATDFMAWQQRMRLDQQHFVQSAYDVRHENFLRGTEAAKAHQVSMLYQHVKGERP